MAKYAAMKVDNTPKFVWLQKKYHLLSSGEPLEVAGGDNSVFLETLAIH
jgi:hypothetical protein